MVLRRAQARSAGGVSSGIYPTDAAKQVAYLVNDSRTRVLFVEDDEQLDKALEARSQCPTLERIVIFDIDSCSAKFSDPMCISFDEFLAQGRGRMAERGRRWDEMIDSRGPDRCCNPGLHLGHDRAAQGCDA